MLSHDKEIKDDDFETQYKAKDYKFEPLFTNEEDDAKTTRAEQRREFYWWEKLHILDKGS